MISLPTEWLTLSHIEYEKFENNGLRQNGKLDPFTVFVVVVTANITHN